MVTDITSYKHRLSKYVNYLYPDYIKQEYPDFLNIIEGFYEYMEKPAEVFDYLYNIQSLVDVDELIEYQLLIYDGDLTDTFLLNENIIELTSEDNGEYTYHIANNANGKIIEVNYDEENNETIIKVLNIKGYFSSNFKTTIYNKILYENSDLIPLTDSNITTYDIKLIMDFNNIIKHFLNTNLYGFKYNLFNKLIDIKTIIKNNKKFFALKGNKKSFEFIFKLIYPDKTISIDFPHKNLFRISHPGYESKLSSGKSFLRDDDYHTYFVYDIKGDFDISEYDSFIQEVLHLSGYKRYYTYTSEGSVNVIDSHSIIQDKYYQLYNCEILFPVKFETENLLTYLYDSLGFKLYWGSSKNLSLSLLNLQSLDQKYENYSVIKNSLLYETLYLEQTSTEFIIHEI